MTLEEVSYQQCKEENIMAVKVGNSWVSEASYARAKANNVKNDGEVTIQSLSKKYPGTNFSVGTSPYNGDGRNNIAIAPNILSQMNEDPEKRLEYEALINDCMNMQKSMSGKTMLGSNIKAQGYIINADGTLGGWSITEPSGGKEERTNVKKLPKDRKELWLDRILKNKEEAKLQAEARRSRFEAKA